MYVTRPFPLAGYCSETVEATVTKFSQIIGTVHPFVVLTFRARATSASPVPGASSPVPMFRRRLLPPEVHVHRQQWIQEPGLNN